MNLPPTQSTTKSRSLTATQVQQYARPNGDGISTSPWSLYSHAMETLTCIPLAHCPGLLCVLQPSTSNPASLLPHDTVLLCISIPHISNYTVTQAWVRNIYISPVHTHCHREGKKEGQKKRGARPGLLIGDRIANSHASKTHSPSPCKQTTN